MALKLTHNLLYCLLFLLLAGCSSANFKAEPWKERTLSGTEIQKIQLEKGVLVQGRLRFQGEESFSGSFLLEAEGQSLRIRIEHSLGPTIAEIYLSPTEKLQWVPSQEVLYKYPKNYSQHPDVAIPLNVRLIRYLLFGGDKVAAGLTFNGLDLQQEGISVRYSGKLRSHGVEWPQKIWLTFATEKGEERGKVTDKAIAKTIKKKLFFYIQSMQWGHFENIQMTPEAQKSALVQVARKQSTEH